MDIVVSIFALIGVAVTILCLHAALFGTIRISKSTGNVVVDTSNGNKHRIEAAVEYLEAKLDHDELCINSDMGQQRIRQLIRDARKQLERL